MAMLVFACAVIAENVKPLDQNQADIQYITAKKESGTLNVNDPAYVRLMASQTPVNCPPTPPSRADACPATNIAALPYTDIGNTCSMTDDYLDCYSSSGAPDVIYEFTAPVTATYTISLCGSSYDTELMVRSGGACPGSVQEGCNDDYCGLQSQLMLSLTAGTQYFVIVDGYGIGCGDYVLNISYFIPECHNCADPILLSGTVWAGTYDLCPQCNLYDLGPCTGWASYAPDMVFKAHFSGDNNDLYVSVDPLTYWDIALAITSVCGDFTGSCVCGEDDMGSGSNETCVLTGLPAGDYFITVSGYYNDCGVFDIYVSSNHQLPVELTSFEGTPGNREAELNWTTASETNNDHFYMTRSINNRDFARVSNDIPAANSPTGGTYSYMDRNLVNSTTYYYKLVDVGINGLENVNGLVAEVTPTLNSNIAPDAYSLHQNYPNPFNPNTSISYDIQEAGHVTLAVFDVLGREVVTLINDNQTAGSYSMEFNASTLSSGIYFYQLKVNDFTDMKKMVVMK